MWLFQYSCMNMREGWAPKNWCFRTVVLEKNLESPLGSKEVKPVNPKEINPEYSLERLVLKLKLQYFGYLMWRVNSLEENPDAGKDWSQEEMGAAEDEMVGWHHWFNQCEFEPTPGNSERGKPGMLQLMRSQRVGHGLATKQQNWNSIAINTFYLYP